VNMDPGTLVEVAIPSHSSALPNTHVMA